MKLWKVYINSVY